jgi:hypothetical protein
MPGLRLTARISRIPPLSGGYPDGFGGWVVFWDVGYTTYPDESELEVIENPDKA